MANNKTTFLEHAIQQQYLRAAPVYLCLYPASAPPNESGGGTEPIGNGYARVLIPFGPPSGSPGQVANNALVVFPRNTGPWGVLTHWGIRTAPTGGSQLYYGAFQEPIDVSTSDPALLEFPAGTIIVEER